MKKRLLLWFWLLVMMLTSFCALAESGPVYHRCHAEAGWHPSFESARAGVVKAGEELGVNAVFTGPTVADAAEQVKMIRGTRYSQGVNAIAGFFWDETTSGCCADPGC